MLAALLLAQVADATIVDLRDGFVRVKTSSYEVEVPKGWNVTRETSFGERTFRAEKGEMTAMTARGAGAQGWDRLYRTSLFFIQRSNPGKATPYELSKTAQGYEAASFSILNEDGFAKARYVILKHPNDNILALSVKIPDRRDERSLRAAFDRMVRTAKLF